MEGTPARKTYLDALRVLACLGVLYNHIAGRTMRFYEGASGAAALWLFFASKAAVALFFMISGALLLGRDDGYAKAWRRILRVALAIVLFSALYYAVDTALAGAAFRPLELLENIWRYGQSGTYWFLYVYLGVLVMAPILQKLTVAFTARDYRYFLLWSLGISGGMTIALRYVPVLQYNEYFQLPLFAAVLGMLVAGRHLDTCAPCGKRTVWAWIAAAALPLLPTFVVLLMDRNAFGLFDNYDAITATGAALGIFWLVKRLDARICAEARIRTIVSRLARLTFGVYLLGDLLIRLMEPARAWMAAGVGSNAAGVLYVLLVFLAGAGITGLLRGIPGLKRLL